MKTVLVVGFGPFLDVKSNPAERLARAVDGVATDDGRVRVVGRVMPVSYARAPTLTLAWAREVGADFVLGVGVARTRTKAAVERVARSAADPKLADVDGVRLARLDRRTRSRVCRLADEFAAALRVDVSDDAGRYVCNAWLYGVLARRDDVAFLHLPGRAPRSGRGTSRSRRSAAISPKRLVAALRELVTRPAPPPSSAAPARSRSRRSSSRSRRRRARPSRSSS